MEQFVVSAIKYRPLSFASVVGQLSIGTTLKNAIQRGHLSHAYLFCGPRGVGKTTCARIFAKTINCLNPTADFEACETCESCRSFTEGRSYSIHELDAASNNSVDDIRLLIEKVRIPPQIGKYSVYIIDEVHMLSSSAFNAFLKTLEEPPAHAIFILATTEKHKILPTILSRCQIYDFNRITIEDITLHLENIAKKEGVGYESDALNIIARKADGAMRDALSIFDRVVSFCGNNISYSAVIDDLNILDYEYYFRLTDSLLARNYTECLMILDEILRRGFDSQHFVSGLSSHFRDLLVCKDPQTIPLLEVGKVISEHYRQQSENCSFDFLFEALNISNKCEVGYKLSGNPRLHVELTLLNLSQIGLEKKNEVSKPKPVEEKEPKPTPKQAVNETPLPEVPKGISLKEITASTNPKPKKEEEKQEPIQISNNFSEESLIQEWINYAEQIKTKLPRLSSRLVEHTPKFITGNLIQYPVINDQYKTVMETHSADLLKYLKTALGNNSISIEWIVHEQNLGEGKQRLYTPQDKINYFSSKNPAFDKLMKDLDLDYR